MTTLAELTIFGLIVLASVFRQLVATVPDMPEPIMLIIMFPGGSAANTGLHQICHGADGGPIGLAQHTNTDQHQQERKQQRYDGQPHGKLRGKPFARTAGRKSTATPPTT